MKNTLRTLACAAIAALAAGCGPSADQDRQATTEQLEKIQQETKAAAQDMKDYAFAQKAEFVKKMQGQLDDLNRQLGQLAARVEKSSDSVKAEAKPKLQALGDQVAKLNRQLDQARNASESTWDDVKAAFNKGINDLKDAFQSARKWASDKLAP